MITTSANWKAYTNVCGLFHIQATMNNGTSLSLTDEDFMDGSVTITDSISGMSSFNIGSVVTNTFSGTLNNFSGKFDNYKLAGATLTVSLGINYDDGVGVMGAEYNTSTSYVAGDYCSRNGHVYVCTGATSGTWNSSKWTQLTTEYISRGVYTVDKPTSLGKTIKITAYDKMDKLNRYYVGKYTVSGSVTDVVFPVTASTFVQRLCDYCGVPYVSGSMWKLGSFVLTEFEYNESTTCRQVISWVMQSAGGFARMNPSGNLECKPFNPGVWFNSDTSINGGTISPWSSVSTYNGGTISPWSSATVYDGGITDGYQYALERLTSLDVFIEDIEITGIRAYAYNTIEEFKYYTVGTSGYIIDLQNNPMITESTMGLVAERVADKALGLNFRPFTATLIGDPSIEANDVIVMNDYLGNPHRSLITTINYALNKQERIECTAETPEANATEVASTSTSTAMGAVTAAYDYINAKKISADIITTGTLSADRIASNSLGVSKLDGTISDSGNTWAVDLTNGTMTIGDLSANNITAGTITGAITATNLTMSGGSVNLTTNSSSNDVISLQYGNNKATMRGGHFEIRTQNSDTLRGELGVASDSYAVVNIYNANGNKVSSLGENQYGGGVQAMNSSGNVRALLAAGSAGGGLLSVYNNSTKRTIAIDGTTPRAVYYSPSEVTMLEMGSYSTSSPHGMIWLFNDSGTGTITLQGSNGGIYASSYNNMSNLELKKNVKQAGSMLSKIVDSDILSFNYKGEDKSAKSHIGLVIGGDYKVPEEVIAESDDGTQTGVDLYAMVSMAWKAIQEQNEKIEALEKRVAELEKGIK